MNRDSVATFLFLMFLIMALFLVCVDAAQGHQPEQCQQTTQQLQTWASNEGLVTTSLEEVRVLIQEWREACRPHPPRSIDRSYSGSLAYQGYEAVQQWRGLVEAHFRGEDIETALCLIYHESRGDPDARNPSSSASGLFQHLARYWDDRSTRAGWGGSSIFDPEANVAVAAWLRDTNGGWYHWAPYGRSLCRGL